MIPKFRMFIYLCSMEISEFNTEHYFTTNLYRSLFYNKFPFNIMSI